MHFLWDALHYQKYMSYINVHICIQLHRKGSREQTKAIDPVYFCGRELGGRKGHFNLSCILDTTKTVFLY